MKILSLNVSNIRGIEALELKPDGKSVIVKGRNASGKTSTLDCIRYVLTGKHGGVHGNAEEGHVEARVGPFIITRRIGGERAALTVRHESTGNQSRPAAFLKELVGQGIALNPLDFASGRPQDRIDAIAAAAGVDLSALDRKRADLYEARTQTWRKKEDVEGAIQEHGAIPDGEDERIDVVALLDELRKIDDRWRLQQVHETRVSQAKARAERAADKIQQQLEEIARLESERENALREYELLDGKEMPDVSDHAELRSATAQQIKDASTTNEAVAKRTDWRHRLQTLDKEHEAQMAEWRNFNEEIATVDEEKAAAAKCVKGRFPGVVIEQEDLHVDGVTFADLNTARQVEVGMRVGINKRGLRVVLIDEASSLDDSTLAEVFAIAAKQDVQVFLCRIDNEEEGLGFDIVEGEGDERDRGESEHED